MQWIFNDGGRAASGFVGLTGDCVPRAIAIATGISYRAVYDELKALGDFSPRQGVFTSVSRRYLEERGWSWKDRFLSQIDDLGVAEKVYLVCLENHRGTGHIAAIIDNALYDTWDVSLDDDFTVRGYWTPPGDGTTIPEIVNQGRESTLQGKETQAEYEKVLRRLRALNNTANNHASTVHEQHNAIRMMQTLMLRHNLSQDDLVDSPSHDHLQYTTMACVLNGSRACNWEHSLARFITSEIFSHVQYYSARRGHRTLFWFYGPLEDVENSIAVFRELLLTIAASAKIKFNGYVRASGASYCEGFVDGLPRSRELESSLATCNALSSLQQRSLLIQRQAKNWLDAECDLRLVSSGGGGRYEHDDEAERTGRIDGAKQELNIPKRTLRLTQK